MGGGGWRGIEPARVVLISEDLAVSKSTGKHFFPLPPMFTSEVPQCAWQPYLLLMMRM